ncbi:MAG: isocitrate lyase/PEP mutase family protein [Reyranella sp.]|uniref:isocitrate lyase/PEP mutase family protein n=1 Tax=Reyranella sp. TaxID=1929291 RepID=UPI001ACDCF16|nr:isocitrate lyase/PEP mutase family protein [Reyranella sp.]MBN9091023.1 isocitrate lyase/PEP mutase family protein [Reyranella sp.]
MSKAKIFRDALKRGMVTAPGCFECIGARAIERAGFEAVYMTGAGTAATLGYPDYGLVTMSEMADNAGRIASAIKLPVIADADTAYGNELNAIRTVREYEKRGVAGIHIEDQDFPKKCGHLENKVIIPLDDYVAKIRAAVSAKVDPNFLIIARTDSRAVLGYEEAIRRANAAIDAGADMAFVEAPQTLEETANVPKLVKGPCMLNMVWKGKTPDLSMEEAAKLNYAFMILPGVLTRTIVGACDAALAELKGKGRHPVPVSDITPQQGFNLNGAAEWDRYRTQFRETTKQAAE